MSAQFTWLGGLFPSFGNDLDVSFCEVVLGREWDDTPGLGVFILTRLNRLMKRMLDLFVSSIACIMGSPIILLIALLIKCTSKGPVLFSQFRIGDNGKQFRIYKFRTMRPDDSSTDHAKYVQSLIKDTDDNKETLTKDFIQYLDRRITPIGRFLRSTSLDELPQLINVLRGEMSMVGPRPHPIYEVKTYKDWYNRRLGSKPGLTGWSKLNIRLTPKDYEEAILYDLWYVDHWNPFVDLKIILKTIPFVLKRTDAH
jgi:lipopolysaccharide/colanic/teichoic acid biosynthesis glycosyltransferase